MTWHLLPGLRLLRRDATHVQVGLDAPRAVVLPDRPAVHRLVGDLATGAPLADLDEDTGPALAALIRASLVEAADEAATRRSARAVWALHLDVPAGLRPAAAALTAEAGLGLAGRGPAAAALVWGLGEVERERADDWMRAATPHLLVTELPGGEVRVGPYVVPGATACLRCIDAHLRDRDPRRDLLVAQAAEGSGLRPLRTDAAVRALALGWAVRDLAVAAEGGRPVSWSATVTLGVAEPAVTAYRRHLHCGCAWDEELAVAGATA